VPSSWHPAFQRQHIGFVVDKLSNLETLPDALGARD